MTALAATPAAADELPPAASEQAVAEQAESTPVEEPAPAVAPVEEPAPAPAEEPAPAPVEEPAPAPAEEAAVIAEAPVAEVAAAESVAPEAEAPVVALLVPPGEEVVDKVEICHATASYRNPYVINEPAADGDVSGHAGHTGPIFYPEIEEQWGDIIPPFYYDDGGEEPAYFPGLNWDEEGQAIYENDCEIPTVVPDLMITVTSCIEGGPDGDVSWTLGPLVALLDYRVTVWDANDDDVATWTFSGQSGTVSGSAGLPPGDYTITVEQSTLDGWELIDEQSFTVEECEEPVVEKVEICHATGSHTNPYVLIEPDANGTVSGHADHTGPIWYPGIEEDWGDIIPPFFYDDGDETPAFFPGLNWTAEGQAIWANDCELVPPEHPHISVVVTECPAYGEEGSALVRLSNLVEGVEYQVWVTARGDMNGTAYDGIRTFTAGASGTAEFEFAPLPPDMDYTAWVHGMWSDVELHASIDFTLQPCPDKPAKPGKHDKPAKPVKHAGAPDRGGLADTGVNDPTGPIAAALLLLGLGGAALIARARREGRTNHSE